MHCCSTGLQLGGPDRQHRQTCYGLRGFMEDVLIHRRAAAGCWETMSPGHALHHRCVNASRHLLLCMFYGNALQL